MKLARLLALFAGLGTASAFALDGKVVLDQMVKKGVLTSEEAEEILKKDQQNQQAEAAKKAEEARKAEQSAPKKAEESKGAEGSKVNGSVETAAKKHDLGPVKKSTKWYDRIKIDGYVQARFTEQLNDSADSLDVPADKSVRPTESLMIRRGRLKVSGDVTDNLYFYSQLDMQATVGSGVGVQARDIYFDLSFDDAKEHRLRAGLSKVPYGWVNLQSSQNRLPMERPEALNSAVEGERDYGVYYMWAGKEHRELFKKLVKEGLKGSGDYGVFTVGAYNGQGLNKSDLNGEPHLLARLSVPWQTASGQIYEAGFGGYVGKYVVEKTAGVGGGDFMSSTRSEFRDNRMSAHFIMYPQPFGLEAEWTFGEGPQLNGNRTRIEMETLQGGYVQASYRIVDGSMEYIPFIRFNYYDGARKFATNAPRMQVCEYDIGTEIQFGEGWELTLVYTYTDKRTNTSAAPYADVTDAHRLAAQLQFNF